MDDLDLDDIDLENFNFDDVSNKNKQKKPQEQAAKPTQNQTQNQNQAQKPVNNNANAADFENRPRLRKIKRPKFHTGPINTPSSNVVNNATVVNTPSPTESYPEHRAPTPATGGGLIRASDRAAQPQTTNQFAPTNLDIQQTPYNNYVTDEDEFVYQGSDNVIMGKTDNKKVLIVAFICLIIGMFMGKLFFSSEQVVHNGLQGVVVNPEVPNGRARCGLAERTQGCVLYIMNPQRQDLNGRDFYDLAAQLTGRQRFVIETGNMRYSSVKIRPGSIAQLNIPPLQ
jgi:hypothetical protein